MPLSASVSTALKRKPPSGSPCVTPTLVAKCTPHLKNTCVVQLYTSLMNGPSAGILVAMSTTRWRGMELKAFRKSTFRTMWDGLATVAARRICDTDSLPP